MKHYEVNVFSKYVNSADALFSDEFALTERDSVKDACEQFCSSLRTFIREMYNANELTADDCIMQLSLASAIEKLFSASLYEVSEYDDHTEIYIEL